MVTLRQRIFAIVGVSLGIIIVVILGILFVSRDTQDTDTPLDPAVVNPNVPDVLVGDNQITDVIPVERPVPVFSTEAQPERLARQVAEIFVERFESRSSANEQQHINRVENFVTSRMWQWVSEQGIAQDDIYTGVTTDVIAARVTEISDSAATVTFDAQLEITDADGQRIDQRSGRVELVADGDGWLVDGFFWEE